MHPLRKRRESGASSPAKNGGLLAENVVLHSPVLVRAVEGREQVAAVFAASPSCRNGSYVAEHKLDDRTAFLRWKATSSRVWRVIVDDEKGLIAERTIAYRPFPALKLLREKMYPILKDVVPADLWDYAATSETMEGPG